MFTPAVRLALVLGCLVAAAASCGTEPLLPLSFLVAAALFVAGHFRHGSVWLAFRAARRGDRTRARRLLDAVRNPALLSAESRAYYHLLRGSWALEDRDPSAALGHLRAVREGDLRTDQDRCISFLAMAEALAGAGEAGEARRMLERARGTPHRESLEAAIEQVRGKIGPGPAR